MISYIHYVCQNPTAVTELGYHTGRAGFYCSNRWREIQTERRRERQRRETKDNTVTEQQEGLTRTQIQASIFLLRRFFFALT